MIRVLGGMWKGRNLDVAAGVGTRPSSGRLREALFSSLGAIVRGAEVHDLFAGTGAIGIEALSRGASTATFVELDPRAVRGIRENLTRLEAEETRWRVRRGDARRWLDRLAEEKSQEDSVRLVLADPPYEAQVVADLLPSALRLLESPRRTVFALEHRFDVGPLAPGPGFLSRTRRHGEGAFTILERDEA